MNLGKYILSTFLSTIGALFVAYTSIKIQKHIEKEHLKKALLNELEENMFKVKGYIDYLKQLILLAYLFGRSRVVLGV